MSDALRRLTVMRFLSAPPGQSMCSFFSSKGFVPHEQTPLIAYMFGATTRGVSAISRNTETLSAFKFALPSLARTVEVGFDYAVVIGYDKVRLDRYHSRRLHHQQCCVCGFWLCPCLLSSQGDRFYDSSEGQRQAITWFAEHVGEPLQKRNVRCFLCGVRIDNPQNKPGHVPSPFVTTARSLCPLSTAVFSCCQHVLHKADQYSTRSPV